MQRTRGKEKGGAKPAPVKTARGKSTQRAKSHNRRVTRAAAHHPPLSLGEDDKELSPPLTPTLSLGGGEGEERAPQRTRRKARNRKGRERKNGETGISRTERTVGAGPPCLPATLPSSLFREITNRKPEPFRGVGRLSPRGTSRWGRGRGRHGRRGGCRSASSRPGGAGGAPPVPRPAPGPSAFPAR